MSVDAEHADFSMCRLIVVALFLHRMMVAMATLLLTSINKQIDYCYISNHYSVV